MIRSGWLAAGMAALLCALATSPARATPDGHGAVGRPAPGRDGLPLRGLDAICGTRSVPGLPSAVAGPLRPLSAPLPTPHSTDAGNIAVLEDDGRFFFSDKNGHVIADLAAIGQSFYRTHGDDYDCLAVYLSSGLTTWLGSPTAIASATIVRNAIEGIGVDPYDVGASLGSAARLQWALSMNGLQRYPADPYADISGDSFTTLDVLGHEFGHRWLSYTYIDSAGTASEALLGRARQHWSFFFDSDASLMEGGNWAGAGPDSFRIDEVSARFGKLDLYLMGLRGASATDSFFTLHDATAFDPPGAYIPSSWPTVGMSCRARVHWWHVQDVAAIHGPRVPNAAVAPHVFRLGVILVTARGSDATPADLAKLDNLRSEFVPYFAAATQGFGAVDATLDSRAGGVRIAHRALADRTDFNSPVPIGARITIDPAGIPIALNPASAKIFWRLGAAGPFSPLPFLAAAGDSFAGNLPPVPAYEGEVQYYLYASSDSAGIAAFDPPAGPAGPHVFHVGPDLVAPVIVHTPMLAQGEARMPVTLLARVTDNAALESVWVEWGVDGALTNTTQAGSVGPDSFAVTIGAGLTAGHTLDYQFVARDSAGNLRFHRSALAGNPPWSLAVGRNWYLDTENGTGGLFSVPGWYSYRDAWHPTQESSSPPGGTAWKCGDVSPLPYAVHTDANLYLPSISSVEPGTLLRFDHRYELEELNGAYAWDGARIEGHVGAGPWMTLTPMNAYSHVFPYTSNPFVNGTPCWSGASGGWRSETVDLSPLAPGPAQVRFRMLADDFVGYDGWTVDAIRVQFPGPVTAVGPASPAATSRPWPNPATEDLRIDLTLPRAGTVAWTLYDLAGRRVASLARAAFEPGRVTLTARLPGDLRPGLYLARIEIEGRPARVDRIAIVR